MTLGLENMNAEMIIWFTWHFHIPLKYYSLFAMQFQLFQLHLTCLLVLWWGEKSWALKWQTMYPLKTSTLPVSASSPEENKWKKEEKKLHRPESGLYGVWVKTWSFCHLDRTQWPGFEVLVLSPRSSFFQVPTVLWHHGCITLQFATPSLL